nr:hypothetical protein Q903MT_gene2187 [Picea sitchensis]
MIIMVLNPPNINVTCTKGMDMDMLISRGNLIINSMVETSMVKAHPDPNGDIWVICDNSINTWCLLDDIVGSWILFDEVEIVPTVNEVQIVPGDT